MTDDIFEKRDSSPSEDDRGLAALASGLTGAGVESLTKDSSSTFTAPVPETESSSDSGGEKEGDKSEPLLHTTRGDTEEGAGDDDGATIPSIDSRKESPADSVADSDAPAPVDGAMAAAPALPEASEATAFSAPAAPSFTVSVTPAPAGPSGGTPLTHHVAAIHTQEEMQALLDVGMEASSGGSGGGSPSDPVGSIDHLGGQLYQLNDVSGLTIDAEYFNGEAGFRNSIGYYFADADGNPINGNMMWSNIKDGGEKSWDLSGDDIPENAEFLGFFIIPNGARHNADLSSNEAVTFSQNSKGEWQVVDSDGEALKSQGRHGPVFFSDAKLNPDYHDDGDSTRGVHVLDHPDVIGNANWEDLRQKSWEGYGDYDDVNMQIDIETTNSDPGTDPDPEPTPLESVVISKIDKEGDSIDVNRIDVSLVPGDPLELTFTVKAGVGETDVDMYLLQDVSGSFYDDMWTMRDLAGDLTASLKSQYGEETKFGIGSFSDKPFNGHGKSYDYAYKHELSLTDSRELFQDTLDGIKIQNGRDFPESQLEALFQTALRADDEIGFRDVSSRFVVVMTDAPAHEANPPEYIRSLLADLGVEIDTTLPENDGDKDLEEEGYPSLDMLRDALVDAGITPIFSVANPYEAYAGSPYYDKQYEMIKEYYESVVDRLGFGSVIELSSDSSDAIEAISNGVAKASTNIQAFVTEDSPYLVSVISDHDGTPIEPGDEVTYTVKLDASSLPESAEGDTVSIEVPGFGEVEINISLPSADSTTTIGSDTADVLEGQENADILYGVEGNDVLNGKGGDDILIGGEGADRFVVEDGAGHDVINDFTSGLDMLDLRFLSGVRDFNDVRAASSQEGDDLLLTFNDVTVKMLGVKELVEEDVLL